MKDTESVGYLMDYRHIGYKKSAEAEVAKDGPGTGRSIAENPAMVLDQNGCQIRLSDATAEQIQFYMPHQHSITTSGASQTV